MSKSSQHFYCATSPLLPTAKLPGPSVTFQTFQSCFSAASSRKTNLNAKEKHRSLYKPSHHKLPTSVGAKEDVLALKRYWKAAGFNSNRAGAAATMMILTGKPNSWEHIEQAWAGSLHLWQEWFLLRNPQC